ncbi:YrzQ family protein [Anoxybacillus flavithermus]|nr:YrzQ family protein [Anoxybacillus flavithermus]MBE2939108.1 YrzQ family protein [Anoxybacillus flavithermus]MBE2941922.1 YrzQ family protein [Anoxybacillus flavithermus]MBE2950159.1 YrzQ family protein [Anoxybacillus flavithermus]MBE2952631.1 YrzQ family protein [Anoxybacillus flavithermus]MBE2957989.1 YrzQ family protein [Anoxybacillus flavithermus]
MTMNRTIASLIAIGAGVAAYQLAQRNGGMNMRNVRKVGRQMLRPFM